MYKRTSKVHKKGTSVVAQRAKHRVQHQHPQWALDGDLTAPLPFQLPAHDLGRPGRTAQALSPLLLMWEMQMESPAPGSSQTQLCLLQTLTE